MTAPTPNSALVDRAISAAAFAGDYVGDERVVLLETVLSILNGAALARPADGWLPIESAPKAAVIVDLYGNDRRISDCFYDAPAMAWKKIKVRDGTTWSLDDFIPTHWRPCPESPAASPSQPAEKGGGE